MGNRHYALEAKDIVKQMNYDYEKYNIDSFFFFFRLVILDYLKVKKHLMYKFCTFWGL
jgi:hypothetical protein